MFLPPCAPRFAFYPLLPDFLSSASARFKVPERLPQHSRRQADGEPTLFPIHHSFPSTLILILVPFPVFLLRRSRRFLLLLLLLLLPALFARAPHAVRSPQLEVTPPAMDLGESEEVGVACVRRVCVEREKAPRIRWSSASPPRPPPPPTDQIPPSSPSGEEKRARAQDVRGPLTHTRALDVPTTFALTG